MMNSVTETASLSDESDDASVEISIDTEDEESLKTKNADESLEELEITSGCVIIRNPGEWFENNEADSSVQMEICTSGNSENKQTTSLKEETELESISTNPSTSSDPEEVIIENSVIETASLSDESDEASVEISIDTEDEEPLKTKNADESLEELEITSGSVIIRNPGEWFENNEADSSVQMEICTSGNSENKQTTSLKEETELESISTNPSTSSHPEEVIIEKQSLHIPVKFLLDVIMEMMISSPRGLVTLSEIEQSIIQKFPFSEKKIDRLRELVANTLKVHKDSFIHFQDNNESSFFQSGFWTLRPSAAIKFRTNNTCLKKTNVQQKHSITDVNEVLQKKPVVVVERSPSLDLLAIMKKKEMAMPSPNIVESLTTFGINYQPKWKGWDLFDNKQEAKICYLGKIVEAMKQSTYTDPSSTGLGKEQDIENNGSFGNTNHDTMKDQLKTSSIRGIKRKRSCSKELLRGSSYSDKKSSVDENSENSHIVNKEYLVSTNLVEDILKIVRKNDINFVADGQICDVDPSESNTQEIKDCFLGFDFDLWSGNCRGWEKVSTKYLEKLRWIIKEEEGTRNLEQVLRESELVVSNYIEELERYKKDISKEMQDEKSDDMMVAIRKLFQELFGLVKNSTKEPPLSYTTLIIMAICSSPQPALSVSEICCSIQETFPFYESKSDCLQASIEHVLNLNSIFIKACQGCRRVIHRGCWKVELPVARRILGCVLETIEIKRANMPISNSQESLIREESMKTNDNLQKHTKKFKPDVTQDSTNKTCVSSTTVLSLDKQENYNSDSSSVQLSGECYDSAKGNIDKHKYQPDDVGEVSNEKVIEKNVKDATVNNSLQSSEPSSIHFAYCPSSHNESLKAVDSKVIVKNTSQDIQRGSPVTAQCGKTLEISETTNSTDPSQVLEIIDIDPSLHLNKNSSVDYEQEFVVIDDDYPVEEGSYSQAFETSSDSDQNKFSPTNGTHQNFQCDVCSKLFQCSFVLKCHKLNNHSENKSNPCYRCHKLFPNSEVLWIHMTQTHLGKENQHISSPLCQAPQLQTKNGNKLEKVAKEPYQNNFGHSEVFSSESKIDSNIKRVQKFNCNHCTNIEPFSSKENLQLHLQSEHSGNGVLRYVCSKCKAVFMDKKTLNLHTAVFHPEENEQSVKLVKTESGTFFYCRKCSGCFHTVKSFQVHTCFPENQKVNPQSHV